VAGVAEHDVSSADDVLDLLTEGNKRRTQEPTAANKESSRSHAVLQILVQQRETYGTTMRVGKLSLIDLAGEPSGSRVCGHRHPHHDHGVMRSRGARAAPGRPLLLLLLG